MAASLEESEPCLTILLSGAGGGRVTRSPAPETNPRPRIWELCTTQLKKPSFRNLRVHLPRKKNPTDLKLNPNDIPLPCVLNEWNFIREVEAWKHTLALAQALGGVQCRLQPPGYLVFPNGERATGNLKRMNSVGRWLPGDCRTGVRKRNGAETSTS